jgi:two-component system response regulator PrrA
VPGTTLPDVLVVDDDAALRRTLERALRLGGFAVRTAPDGDAALEEIARRAPAAVVLDMTMPGTDGLDVIRRSRGRGEDMPICVLSARDGVDDRILGLQAGADDYLTKPFDTGELLARLHALLRRRGEPIAQQSEAGPVRVDRRRHLAWLDDEPLELTGREFGLLACLVEHAGVVLTRDQLLDQVWGYDFEVGTNVVDVFVGYLRRKLEADGRERILRTVRGQGFMLRA